MTLPPLRTWSRTLHGRVVFPIVARLRGESDLFDHRDELTELESLTRSQLVESQEARLSGILAYAAGHAPRYRGLLDPSDPPAPGEVSDALRRFPLLEKQELQQSGDALRARPQPGRVSRKTTGGSTGEPVTVLKDREATARNRGAFWYGVGWNGVKIGDRGARFWGSPGERNLRRLKFWAADVAMNRIRLSAFAFDESDLESYWRRCLLFGPDYFYGYVSMLEAFARHVRHRGHDGSRLELKSIVTTAEVLGDPQRELLEDVFDAPVQNEYGCGEIGPIAYECSDGSLHVLSENVYVELLDDDGRPVEPGETGHVVVTDLNNRAMPLIRYRLGDFAVQGGRECACGRGFPTLERIWGREYDFVVTPDERKMHGEFFLYLFEDLRDDGVSVGQFRVTQRGSHRLDVEIVPEEESDPEIECLVATEFQRRLGTMDVSVRAVDRIERAPSGKMRVVRNEWLAAPEERG